MRFLVSCNLFAFPQVSATQFRATTDPPADTEVRRREYVLRRINALTDDPPNARKLTEFNYAMDFQELKFSS